MSRLVMSIIVVALLCTLGSAWGQLAVTVKVAPTGLVTISNNGVDMAVVELSAHGPQWKHAPQITATAQIADVPEGKQVTGTLPLPNIEGGAINFVETIKTLPGGLQLEYDLSLSKAMKLNGLQVSILLPVAQWTGKELVMTVPEGNPRTVSLTAEQETFQGFGGEASKIEAGAGTPAPVSVELRAAADIMVQDLRKWEQQVFEIRFPAIMEDAGVEVAADEKFHLVFMVSVGAPVTIE